ncbi:hypothetical protein M378DRAFT_167236 [Amanita muscaria Koide BX008]|uniref:Uncharacterized protein n=1 Tax=Amanita muscaria (strain Koide BX008) TaxID=946122 RepID=A0A0C2SDV5_AMAMK|nr:hypothetical protein M378DRAFT_167236 [Amanita muscaria Koide BX008]
MDRGFEHVPLPSESFRFAKIAPSCATAMRLAFRSISILCTVKFIYGGSGPTAGRGDNY